MSVKITNRQYVNPFTDTTELEKPDWLLGNTGDWINAVFDVEAAVEYIPSSGEPISINYEERTIKLNNGKKWSDYGFDINRTIKFQYTKTTEGTPETHLFDLEISNVQNDTMEYLANTDMDDIGYEILPTDRGLVKLHGIKLYDDRDLQGVRLTYSNIPNEDIESHSLSSVIDGTKTEAIFVGLNNLTNNSWNDMELVGLQSGMAIQSAKVRKIPINQDNEVSYIIPDTGSFILEINPNKSSKKQSVGMNKQGAPEPNFQSSVRQTYTSVADPNQMFIYNSDFAGERNVHIKVGTIIESNSGGGNGKKLSLILRRWNGGSSLNPVSETILVQYPVNLEVRGIQQLYDDVVTIDIAVGDSYSLDYSWSITNPSIVLSPTVRFRTNFGSAEVINIVDDVTYKRRYQFQLSYMLASFFDDLQVVTQKQPPEYLENEKSLTDNMEFIFMPEWNNPNISVKNDMGDTERLGNSGWFDENYNGLINRFKVEEFRYYNSGGFEVNALSFSSVTKIKARISGVSNLTEELSRVTYGFAWLPIEDTDYKNLITPYHKNTKINSPEFQTFGLGTTNPVNILGFSNDDARMDARNIVFSQMGDDVVFECEFVPTPEFATFFENKVNDRKYLLWVSVEDSELVTNFSDRVNLLLDVRDMENNIVISGELPGVTNRFIEHPEGTNVAGVAAYDGYLEDDILSRAYFSMDLGKRLNQISFGYEVENTETGSRFELEKIAVNLSQYVSTPQGIQQINYSATRGYKLAPGNNKNLISITRNESGDLFGKASYQILYGQKIRWEDWIQKFNVPNEYFDSTQMFDGSNNDWLHYLRKSNLHRINFFIIFEFIDNGERTNYKNKFPIRFGGYDENDNITTDHAYYDHTTNTLLNVGTDPETGKPLGVILSNKYTRIEITYTKPIGTWNLDELYAVTTFEIDKGAGVMSHRQLSSIVQSESDNILIPLPTEEKLKVELVAPNVLKTTCLVDFTRLPAAARYKITGRVGCFLNDDGEPVPTRIYDESQYELNYE